jgi:hypothetical protein
MSQQISKPSERQALRERHKKIKSHQDAAAYIQEVENKIRSRRTATRQASAARAGILPHEITDDLAAGKTPLTDNVVDDGAARRSPRSATRLIVAALCD